MSRRPKIGLRQAQRLCQMEESKRLAFLSEGLPIILRSAQGAWEAALQLQALHGRESAILEGVATEEAAKILILMDAVRCPAKLAAAKMNSFVGRFYDHLTRLIYAKAASWRPMDLAELRKSVDRERRGHYLEGHAGEYIMPNSEIYRRESRLYVDIEAYQDGNLVWTQPAEPISHSVFGPLVPPAIQVGVAMERLGMFTPGGLKAASQIWGSLEFRDEEDCREAERLTEQMLTQLQSEGLIFDTARNEDIGTLYQHWQMPMYNLDFSLIQVSMEELEAEQDREMKAIYR